MSLYRIIMKITHKYHWHYAPPSYPDGDTHLWCKWCGFRQTVKLRDRRQHWNHMEIDIRHCSECQESGLGPATLTKGIE